MKIKCKSYKRNWGIKRHYYATIGKEDRAIGASGRTKKEAIANLLAKLYIKADAFYKMEHEVNNANDAEIAADV